MGESVITVKDNEIQDLKNLKVAFNEKAFLLVFNAEKEDSSDGYMVAISAEHMKEIIDGLYSCGLEYQNHFGTSIGFTDKRGIEV